MSASSSRRWFRMFRLTWFQASTGLWPSAQALRTDAACCGVMASKRPRRQAGLRIGDRLVSRTVPAGGSGRPRASAAILATASCESGRGMSCSRAAVRAAQASRLPQVLPSQGIQEGSKSLSRTSPVMKKLSRSVKDWLGIDGHAGLNVPVVGVVVAGFVAELVRRQAVQDIGQAVQKGVVHLHDSFEVWVQVYFPR